ncbi:scavenger receptor class B, member [Chamberlinius hualienensis]
MGCHSCCYGPKAAILAASIGALLCIGFALTFHYMPDIVTSVALLILPINPGGISYKVWAIPPIELTCNLYVFNYTNGYEYLKNWKSGTKLKVEQKGPYTYTAHLNKVFFDWSQPPFLSYRQIETFHFHSELSNGTEDDIITIPNPVTAVFVTMIQSEKIGDLLSRLHLIDKFLENEPAFINVSVGDFLAYGYYDEYLDNLQKKTVEIMPGGRIGILYGRNATDDGKYTVDRGINDPLKVLKIAKWNDQSSFEKEWGDEYCGMINGTDGSLYPAGLTKEDRIYTFVSFLKRSLYANFTNTLDYKGVKGYRYQVPLQYYADYALNPDNKCLSGNHSNVAYSSGVLYMGKIAHGAPLYMSNPHFFDGDFRLLESFEGLNPNKEEHCSEIGVIPEFGVPILGNVRLQLNILMSPGRGMNATKDWPTVMLPLAWGNGSGSITDEMAVDIKKYYYGGMKGVMGSLIGSIIISGLVGLSGIFCSYKLMFHFKYTLLTNPYPGHEFKLENNDKSDQFEGDEKENKTSDETV